MAANVTSTATREMDKLAPIKWLMTTEKVRLIVHDKRKPIKSMQMDVFAYA